MQLYTPQSWNAREPGKMYDWPPAINMLVCEIHEIKPNDILWYVKNARTPTDWIQGPRVGTQWTQRFRGPVPDWARVPLAPMPWVTLWEAEQVCRDSTKFTELQCQSLLQALRLLEAEEERTTQIGGL